MIEYFIAPFMAYCFAMAVDDYCLDGLRIKAKIKMDEDYGLWLFAFIFIFRCWCVGFVFIQSYQFLLWSFAVE